ncbi:MAG: RimK family alpha-L-glutamate ligase [Pirellulales bacterium]
MQIDVLCTPNSWYLRDLRRAAAGDHQIARIDFRRLMSLVDRAGTATACADRPVLQSDAVLVRTMPPGSLEQVVFRMDALGQIEESGVVVLNPPRAIETAVDKFLGTARLRRAGMRVPRTAVCQESDEAMEAFRRLGGDVVIKPLFGSEGRGITRICDEALALRAVKMLAGLGAVLYLQEYVPHNGYDLRLLVIGRHVLGIRRRNPHDWRTNVSRGAIAERIEVTDDLARMARQAADAVGAPLAGVDLLPARDGELYALEVNAVPGWRALARTLEVDVARMVLQLTASLADKTRDLAETGGAR